MTEFEFQHASTPSEFARAPMWPALAMTVAVVVASVWFVYRFNSIEPRAAVPPPQFGVPIPTSTSIGEGQPTGVQTVPSSPAETTRTTAAPTSRPGSDPTQVAVPDLVGQEYANAAVALQRAGLSSRRENVASAEPAGVVVDQLPRTGTVQPGSVVILKVSTGQPATFAMPDLVGMTSSDAERTLRDSHRWTGRLNIVDVETDDPSKLNTILEQQPAPGQECAHDAQVDLLIATQLGTARSTGPSTTP